MAAAPSILDTPQLAASTHLDDISWLRACELRGRLTISLSSPRASESHGTRRPLLAWLNGEIEAHLEQVGASPGVATSELNAHASLSDQVYRARLLGYTGLAIACGSLRGFSADDRLDAVDGWALLDFCAAARELHVDVRLASDDRRLLVLPRPVALDQLVPSEFATLEPEALSVVAPGNAVEVEREATLIAPPSPASKAREPAAQSAARSMRAAMQDLLNDEPASLDDIETPVSHTAERTALRVSAPTPNEPVVDLRSLEPSAPTPGDANPAQPPAVAPAPAAEDARAKPVVAQALATITPTPQPTPAVEAASGASVDKLIRELQATDGTCGWDEIEYRFTHCYLPLQQMLSTIAQREAAEKALLDWASAFAQSYRSAFEALRNNRGKRPRMVLDVPSHAFQLSRKLEIEQCKLVLVDAMRADLAPIVMDKLRLQMMHTAECVGDGLLWSALPSTTAAQMELIARGTDSLRHYTGELSEEQLLSRGNDLRKLRPVRVGSHRMYKLDIVQYLTRDTAVHDRAKLEQYAAEIATSVGRFLRQQGPNSLVYVFGDHGFGGACEASPENVLVPYVAWRLLG